MAEIAQVRSHAICWTGADYEHRCQRPSGRRCIDCGEPAGTLWGPIWCPGCDVIRLDNVSAGFAAIEQVSRPGQPAQPTAAPSAAGGADGGAGRG